jgi:poly(hydroxyalkanoate) granule-associated protein
MMAADMVTAGTMTADTMTAGTMIADTMPAGAMQAEEPAASIKVEAGADMHAAVEQQAAKVKAAGRKFVLAYLGAGAYVLDGFAGVYRRGERLLASAEKRGAVMERDARRRFGNLEEQAVHEMRKLQGQAEESMQQMRESRGSANEEVEKRVELALANMGLPSRERLERLSQEIDALNQKLDEQILRLPADPIPDQLG